MQDKTGTNKYVRQGTADVSAAFYAELYTSTMKTHRHEDRRNQPQHTMTPFTMQEVVNAINQLKKKKNKGADARGANAKTPVEEPNNHLL